MIAMLAKRFCLLAAVASLVAGGFTSTVDAGEPQTETRAGSARGELRHLTSEHLRLATELAPSKAIDQLPALFDEAVAAWCEYFAVDPAHERDWSVQAWLVKSADRLPPDANLPAFASGYSRGRELWLVDQPSDYYRRHLLLHEGTHVFMDSAAGGKGPPWLAEGVAELLATHRVQDGRLVLNVMPRSREEVPKWGRIEMIETARSEGHALSLEQIFSFDARASLDNRSYAWCWAAAVFFDHQEQYRSRFRELARTAGADDFSRRFQAAFADDWPTIRRRWPLYVANLDYGYDFARNAIEFGEGADLPPAGAKVEVAAGRSWQSAGVRLEAGKRYRLRASGRYQVAREPRPWWCEPGGVTIRYYRGNPLGILLAAVADTAETDPARSGLLDPLVVGLDKTIVAPLSGTLYLRVNDSAGSLDDNAGSLTVEIQEG